MTRKIVSVLLVAVLILGGTVGICAADEPHMRAALEHLREAKEHLEKAAPIKEGTGKRQLNS